MRRWPTWLLVGALAALGAVAAADALRGRAEEVRAKPPPPAPRATVVQRDEPSGVLYYSDSDDDCRLHGIGLPGLENAPPPKLQSCEFSLSPDGTAALPGTVSWSPRGGIYASESAGMIELGSPASAETLRFPGHAPAFMPDGTFTYVRGKAVVAWTTDCPSGARLFTLPADNATARCRRAVARLGEPVRRLTWLSPTRMAVVVQPSEYELVIRDRRRVFVRVPGWGSPITDLRVSPRGSYVAVQAEGRGGLLVFHRDGSAVPLPPLSTIRSLAWSPDERWTAAATDFSVFVFRTNKRGTTVRRLAITARDLAWR